MITITEISPPLKISGLSSLIVQFDYNQYIIDSIKTIPTTHYHKAHKCWEIPLSYLGRLLDNLTFLDEIQLKLLDTPESSGFHFNRKFNLEPLSEIEKISFKAKPFKHQFEAVDFLLKQEKSLLLDGCGVGKSLEMILFAETLKKRGIIDHCLVITGIAGLRSNWEKEIQKFSTESAVVKAKYLEPGRRHGKLGREEGEKRGSESGAEKPKKPAVRRKRWKRGKEEAEAE